MAKTDLRSVNKWSSVIEDRESIGRMAVARSSENSQLRRRMSGGRAERRARRIAWELGGPHARL